VLIWIGRFEAYAISLALEGAAFDRPMTHVLLKNAIERLGGRVDRILVDDLWQDTYYAKISVSTATGTIDIDARPSDALALALRAGAPIYMADSVLESGVNEDQL
jgi:bifunctional DNase/RNase